VGRRLRRGLVGIVSGLLLALFAATALSADSLPDLGMARPADFSIEKTPDGRRLLRYSNTLVNVGQGPMEARGARSSTSQAEMTVTQWIYSNSGAPPRSVPTTASMYFAGDGHTHWHLRDLEHSELLRSDNGVRVGTSAKHGFCLAENVAYRLSLPGAPQSPVYRNCGAAASLNVSMGLSVGWGDHYDVSLPDQYIEVTGLGNGRYRFVVTADAGGWFAESNEGNNSTWVDLLLHQNGRRVKVLAYGPTV
jgi:hypothetical protein